MDVSLSSARSRGYICNCSAEPFLLKSAKIPTWERSLMSLSSNRRIGQPLFARTGPLSAKDNSAKVISSLKKEVTVVEGRSMCEVYDALAERLIPTAAAMVNPNLKYIVGLAGSPGAGKSTVANEVVQRVNKLWPQKACALDSQVTPPAVAAILPMDGFHLYRSQLDAMENPEEAHARRGAPWTFRPELLLKCLKALRSQGSVYAPSFDHGVGDPVEDDIFVSLQRGYTENRRADMGNLGMPRTLCLIDDFKISILILCIIDEYAGNSLVFLCRHKVVIVEGNYLLLDDGAWKEISSMFDEKWFIDVDIDKAMERVRKRHISTGKPPDVAKWRIENNDRPNAETVNKSKKYSDLIIRSVDY